MKPSEAPSNTIGAVNRLPQGMNASFNQSENHNVSNATHQRHQLTGPGGDRNKKKNKEEITCKWCPTCNIIKTPRVFHCKICDACISVHDHHCPWLGTCVGQRNHMYFMAYSWATKVHALFCFILNVYFIATNPNKMDP